MEQSNINTLPPSYRELLVEAGKQLNLRKGTLFRRILLITWPLLLFVAFISVASQFSEKGISPESSESFSLILLLILWAIFMTLWGLIIRTIFALEKRIWIDSYFDQKNLDSHASWRIAKKLFWPALGMRLNLFYRFYLLPWGIYFLSLFLWGLLTIKFNVPVPWYILPIIFLGGLLAIGLYIYFYLRIKLRYAWFLFLDDYGKSEFNYQELFNELRTLNDVSKSEMYRKVLLTNLGTDSIEIIIDSAVDSLAYGLGQLGSVGKVFGGVTKVFGEEGASQAASFGNIVAMYLLYRFARTALNKPAQEVNEIIYQL